MRSALVITLRLTMNQETDAFVGIPMSLWVINFYVPNLSVINNISRSFRKGRFGLELLA